MPVTHFGKDMGQFMHQPPKEAVAASSSLACPPAPESVSGVIKGCRELLSLAQSMADTRQPSDFDSSAAHTHDMLCMSQRKGSAFHASPFFRLFGPFFFALIAEKKS